ncbi:MAG: family 43 glycosylhydrolase, partial [candidate division KSB1 bacterium]|nr:family 43 glycosylhydrolase [candidate division KSB1 bacterium]
MNYRFMVDAVDAREAADPVMVLFKGDYYLFASRSGGYWTSPDLNTWRLIVPSGLDVESYAPAVIAMRDTLFYLPGGSGQIYKTADPKSGLWQKGPLIKGYGDPAFFLDDDGRLYLSYGVSNAAPISIVELDPITFREKGTPVNVVYADAKRRGWERRGDDNLLDEQPWIEGSQLIKHNGKYYLLYSAPGTEFKTYADGIYTASSPLGPYQYAPYSPFSFKPTGFITGSGHGWTFQDKDGRWWRVVTMTISIRHMFERRLGLFPVDFDADGFIRCNTALGDYPQFLPGLKDRPIDDNWSGMLLLSHKKKVLASSSIESHGPELAVDEEVRTYWSAATGNADEWLLIDLGKICSIEAVQVNLAEHNTVPEQVRGRDVSLYQQYLLEWSADGVNWETLVDKSRNTEDVPHDYIELPQQVPGRYVRLKNVFVPGRGTFAVRDLRIFGNSRQAVFTPVAEVKVERNPADGRDAVIRWSPVPDADGYLIRYGIAPNKLYNSFIVYDANTLSVHCLNQGTEYYFSVEAFDAGIDYYKPVGEFRSRQSGRWSDPACWAQFDGAAWIYPAPKVPDHTDGPVTISKSDTLLVDQNVRIDELRVESGGMLSIADGAELTVVDDLGIDLAVEGTVVNRGVIVAEPTATISFYNTGRYEHMQVGGAVPLAVWRPNSICRISEVVNSAPENLLQNFFHFVWDCPNQTASVELGWNGNTVGGNVIVNRTGNGTLLLCSP